MSMHFVPSCHVGPILQVDASLSARYMDLLSPEERAYVEAAVHPQVAKERLLARVLTRMTLARCAS